MRERETEREREKGYETNEENKCDDNGMKEEGKRLVVLRSLTVVGTHHTTTLYTIQPYSLRGWVEARSGTDLL